MRKELTPKQQRFVSEFLIDCNASAAAIRAGYSKRTASRIGPDLLGKNWVAAAIKTAMDHRAAKVERNAVAVLADIRRVCIRAMAEGDHKAALKALELEGRHLGMFEKHNNQKRPIVSVIDFTGNGRKTVTVAMAGDPLPEK